MVKDGKISNYHILLFLAIPYLIPAGLTSLPFFSLIAKIKYICIAFALLVVIKKRVVEVNTLFMQVVVFCTALISITILKGTDILSAVKLSVDMLFPVLWASILLAMNGRRFIRFLTRYYTTIAALNFVLIVLFPQGIVKTTSVNAVNLLGDDNKMFFTLICGLGISLYYNQKYGNKRKVASAAYILVYFSSLIKIWAATGIVSMTIVLLIWYFDCHTEMAKRIFTLRNIVIAVGLFFYFAVFSNVFQQGIFADFMVNVLHKNVTFSARTTLWAQAIPKILASPLFGYGYGVDTIYAFSFTGAQGVLGGFSCHDGYLRLLLEGGFFLLILYALIYIRLYRSIKVTWVMNQESHILVFCLAGFLIACIFEAEYMSFLQMVVLEIIYKNGKESAYVCENQQYDTKGIYQVNE